jgi:hypothetical protein
MVPVPLHTPASSGPQAHWHKTLEFKFFSRNGAAQLSSVLVSVTIAVSCFNTEFLAAAQPL